MIDPSMMGAMGGGPGGPPAAIQIPGGDPSQSAGPSDPGSQDPDQMISDALDMIREALSADGLTEQERLTIEKVTTLLQQIPAGREKEKQAMMGMSQATKGMANTMGRG